MQTSYTAQSPHTNPSTQSLAGAQKYIPAPRWFDSTDVSGSPGPSAKQILADGEISHRTKSLGSGPPRKPSQALLLSRLCPPRHTRSFSFPGSPLPRLDRFLARSLRTDGWMAPNPDSTPTAQNSESPGAWEVRAGLPDGSAGSCSRTFLPRQQPRLAPNRQNPSLTLLILLVLGSV